MVVIEEADSSILGILNDAIPEAERNFANDMITVHVSTVTVNRENVDASFEKGTIYIFLCIFLYKLKYQSKFIFNMHHCPLYEKQNFFSQCTNYNGTIREKISFSIYFVSLCRSI